MMSETLRVYKPGSGEAADDAILNREWLVTNGMGGYSSGTLGGVNNWRYHGLLISAEPAPLGRMMMLKHLAEEFEFSDGRREPLNDSAYFQEFRLECGLPVWRYDIGGTILERRIVMPHGQNTVYISYKILHGDEAIRLNLKPYVQFRPHEASYDPDTIKMPFSLTIADNHYMVTAGPDLPILRMVVQGQPASFVSTAGVFENISFRQDKERGYDPRGIQWNGGYFSVPCSKGADVTFIASTENFENIEALNPSEAQAYEIERRSRLLQIAPENLRSGFPAELVLAADQFVITPAGRVQERVRAQATEDSVRAVIAGYHWFTDWGRDTMISLEGLTLVTGRHREARWILRTLSRYIRNGLLPNFFPDGKDEGVYHTADATLWFFHAIDRYLTYTNDRATLRLLLPRLLDVANHHKKGTRFGIGIDPADGLLKQGESGYQLTWMDAKVGDWVVTPRRGKTVELNALLYNALCLLSGWLLQEGQTAEAAKWQQDAEKLKASFNQRFWSAEQGWLFDVIDGEKGDDLSCRPNQLISMSLRYPVLELTHWESVLDVVKEKLLTPFGLRTLSADHPDYQAKYFGDLKARDAAYHQGTVWPWLIGPFVDAWMACYPEQRAEARKFLDGFNSHLDQACIGTINEIFDAEAPFTPRGCIAQAWSVAEVLRCWHKTEA